MFSISSHFKSEADWDLPCYDNQLFQAGSRGHTFTSFCPTVPRTGQGTPV